MRQTRWQILGYVSSLVRVMPLFTARDRNARFSALAAHSRRQVEMKELFSNGVVVGGESRRANDENLDRPIQVRDTLALRILYRLRVCRSLGKLCRGCCKALPNHERFQISLLCVR